MNQLPEKNAKGQYVKPVSIGTIHRASLERQRYDIYVTCATDLGWTVKTFDEWLNS